MQKGGQERMNPIHDAVHCVGGTVWSAAQSTVQIHCTHGSAFVTPIDD